MAHSNIRIEGIIKMKVVHLHQQTPKQFPNPTPSLKTAHQGHKKSNPPPKLSQNQKSELKETQKIKVVQLQKQTPNQFLIRTPTLKTAHQGPKKSKTVFDAYPNPKNSPLGPQKVKIDPKIKSNSNVQIEGIIENESC